MRENNGGIMEIKEAEKTNTANEQTPASVPAENTAVEKVSEKTEVVENKPVETKQESTTSEKPANDIAEKKQISAFIKMRKENRELKRKLSELSKRQNTEIKQTDENDESVSQDSVKLVSDDKKIEKPEPPQVNYGEIEGEEEAIKEISNDKEIASIPGAVIDILEMVDNNPRLSKLYHIDPVIAIREAKNIYKEQIGISSKPSIPKPTNISTGMSGGRQDLNSLFAELERTNPASSRYRELTKMINEAMRK